MGEEINLAEVRDKCGAWDEELETCEDDFPEGCPYKAECQKEAAEE